MTYSEAITYLGEARRFGMKLGLDRMQRLARALGQPQDSLRFIHLAGTNGKGSTAAFCESCLRESGSRVGLYTSPHLVSIRERIQINRELISTDDFAVGMTVVRRAAGEEPATFFELMTALALWTFAREKVGWVVWETGLGGRFDATNIVRPEMCIITNIGLDHQAYLGDTVAEIAAEKAGIIKRGVPVICGAENTEARDVIIARAEEEASPVTWAASEMPVRDLGFRNGRQFAQIGGREYELALVGPHQIANAACAVAALRELKIPDAAIVRGLRQTVWPGRFEILSEKPLIVLDGAHNPAGVRKLLETWNAFLKTRFSGEGELRPPHTHLVFASVADKDISEMAQLLRPVVREVSLVRLANERSAEPSQLAAYFPGIPCVLYDSVTELRRKLDGSDFDKPILITGSLFLVGEMLAQRDGTTEEYRLNERLESIISTR